MGIGLEVNADKPKYMVISRDHSTGRRHYLEIDSNSLESMEQFKYLERSLTNQNSIHEEITSRRKSGNACYHSVQNLSSSVCYPKIKKLRYAKI